MTHPISGPMPIEKFRSLIDAPCGKAREEIRKFCPHYGLEPGQKPKWEVTFKAEIEGSAVVEAETLEEAEKIADKLKESEIEWDHFALCDIEIDSVEPTT